MQLTKPDEKYANSFAEAIKEWDPMRNHEYLNLTDEERADINLYINKFAEHKLGENLPESYVPYSMFWLVDDDNKFYGSLSIRHELNKALTREGGHIGYNIRPSARGKGYGKLQLKLGLEKAKELGLERVLITCDVGNTASRKIIEANKGVFQDKYKNEKGSDKLRFWINLKD